ncbi:hypothetical protein [Yunchengibacter salinarum]|uniref:hypothetical protein n=1 Tax=Yunchengibacter salinarum TaxID=3133399 RepID=UPI0035B60CE8
MIDSRPDRPGVAGWPALVSFRRLLPAAVKALALMLCVAVVPALPVVPALIAAPAAAQDDADGDKGDGSDQDQPEEQTEEAPDQTVPDQTAPIARDPLLGAQETLPSPRRPAMGQPTTILPSPYLPKGALAPRPDMLAPETAEDTEDAGETTEETGARAAQEGAEGSAPDQDADTRTETPQSQPMRETDADGIVAGQLAVLDPSGLGVLPPEEGVSRGLFAGLERAGQQAMLARFQATGASRVLDGFAERLALSELDVVPARAPGSVSDFFAARLALLRARGDLEGFVALVDALPRNREWPALARQQVDAHLAAGRLQDACLIGDRQRSDDRNPFWVRLAAFCRAASGDRQALDFQLGILEEIYPLSAAFYRLTDRIVAEAEGDQPPRDAALTTPLRGEVLEAAMARLAQVQVTELADEGGDPLAANMLLSNARVQPGVKIALIDRFARRGALALGPARAFVRAYEASNAQVEDAFNNWITGDGLGIDLALASRLAHGARLEARLETLRPLLERLARHHGAAHLAAIVSVAARDLPQAEVSPADKARLVRLHLLAGEHDRAARWLASLRQSRAGDDPSVDAVLIDLWPVLLLSGMDTAPVSDTVLWQDWFDAMTEPEDKAERDGQAARVALVFSLLDGIGHPVPDTAWARLSDGAAYLPGGAANPQHWRQALIHLSAGRVGAGLGAAMPLLATRPAQGGEAGMVPPAVAGSLAGALTAAGRGDLARQLAVEMLLGAGY